jgi:hypothetical protein
VISTGVSRAALKLLFTALLLTRKLQCRRPKIAAATASKIATHADALNSRGVATARRRLAERGGSAFDPGVPGVGMGRILRVGRNQKPPPCIAHQIDQTLMPHSTM